MADEVMLVFTEKHIDFFAEKADGLVFKKGPADAFDGPLFKFTFKQINKVVSPKVPDNYKLPFQEALDQVVNGDYDDAGAEAIDVIKELVKDWKGMKDSVKDLIFGVLDIAKGVLAGVD